MTEEELKKVNIGDPVWVKATVIDKDQTGSPLRVELNGGIPPYGGKSWEMLENVDLFLPKPKLNWVKTSERLPTKEDATAEGFIFAFRLGYSGPSFPSFTNYNTVRVNAYWAPANWINLPELEPLPETVTVLGKTYNKEDLEKRLETLPEITLPKIKE